MGPRASLMADSVSIANCVGTRVSKQSLGQTIYINEAGADEQNGEEREETGGVEGEAEDMKFLEELKTELPKMVRETGLDVAVKMDDIRLDLESVRKQQHGEKRKSGK
ncbi:unnamed protein product [Allacma fusca]|uniref:Uncharacterized protein n=1 Tax=Allacma fusca TaxID=39272 RepID=A0A8J2PV91_9HEXA|nr:unnamed protein product [Allacma fusca]